MMLIQTVSYSETVCCEHRLFLRDFAVNADCFPLCFCENQVNLCPFYSSDLYSPEHLICVNQIGEMIQNRYSAAGVVAQL